MFAVGLGVDVLPLSLEVLEGHARSGQPPVEILLHSLPREGLVETHAVGHFEEDVLVVAALAGRLDRLAARELAEAGAGRRELVALEPRRHRQEQVGERGRGRHEQVEGHREGDLVHDLAARLGVLGCQEEVVPDDETTWTGSSSATMALLTSEPWVMPRMGNSRAP